jgi:hypothetical protein
MAEEFDKESTRRLGAEAQDRLGSLVEGLRAELASLREQIKSRDTLIERLTVQLEERDRHWADRERQWVNQRETLSLEIETLRAAVGDLGLQLKISRGMEPSSEKGASVARSHAQTGGGGGGGDNGDGGDQPKSRSDGPSHQKQRYLGIFERERSCDPAQGHASKQAYWEAVGSDPGLIPPPATIFGSQLFSPIEEEKASTFTATERLSLFGRERGLHSKKDKTTIYDLRLALAEITCTQENLQDLAATVYFRKGNALGPAGCQMSWQTLATVASLVAEYAFPMERLAKAAGNSYFSSANISRWMIQSATALVHVYIAAGKALGHCPRLRMDDTSALVLAMRQEARLGLKADKSMSGKEWDAYLDELRKNKKRAALLVPVIDAFGRVAERVDATGAKLSVNVTLISGQLVEGDYRSRVYFYRTHFGQAGNLLSRLLEYRPAGMPSTVVVQSDCSSQNHIEADVARHTSVRYVGCTSHARRPIFRYKARDEELCYYLLRCFAALANVEAAIRRGPMTAARILRYRQRYAAKVWVLISAVCQAVIDENEHKITGAARWRKGQKLYDACAYIIRHFDALTFYLTDPWLEPDNNAIEQGLRGEKLIENASLFRKSELGRIALDIHRTFIATCNACSLPYRDFLRSVMIADKKDVMAHPERYFPHVIAARVRDPPSDPDQHKAPTRPHFSHETWLGLVLPFSS